MDINHVYMHNLKDYFNIIEMNISPTVNINISKTGFSINLSFYVNKYFKSNFIGKI